MFRLKLTSHRRPGRTARGFSIIEVVVIVMIIGIVAAFVVPQALAAEVAQEAADYEPKEQFLTELIQSGRSIKGVYPPNADTLAEYEEWKKRKGL